MLYPMLNGLVAMGARVRGMRQDRLTRVGREGRV